MESRCRAWCVGSEWLHRAYCMGALVSPLVCAAGLRATRLTTRLGLALAGAVAGAALRDLITH